MGVDMSEIIPHSNISSYNWLVVWSLEHDFLWLSSPLGIESLSQLTFTPLFFRGVGLNHQPDNISHSTANIILNKPVDIGKIGVYWIFNQIIDTNIHWGLVLDIIEIILQADNNPNGLVKLKPESSTIFRSWSFPAAIFPSNPLRYGMYQLMGIYVSTDSGMGQVTHEITICGRNKWNNHSHLSSDFWGFYCMRTVVATCPFLAVCIPAALRAGASGILHIFGGWSWLNCRER